ncbi:tectonin domain-containing protein [Streptomyces sp. NPDC088730]|uniref:tectonin domain-containing protein n=1 Tax=Streptomyces sp. NPDC088730 TaxID=3365877 RepID=UPI0038102EFE
MILRRVGVVMAGALTAGILSAFPALADDGAPAADAPVALGGVAATGDDQLFALAEDHSAVYRWSGEGSDWTKVGGPAETLLAGGAGLFATAPDTGKVFKYEGTPDAWSPIGEPGADFAVTGDRLYALNPDRTAVYEWAGTGTDWTKVGGPANDLEAGGAGLFAVGPEGKIFKYEGTPESWTQIGEPGADFAVTGDHVYGLAADRTAVYEWAGHGTDWSRVGGPAQDLYAGGAGLFATDPATGQLSKYDGKPDAWTKAGDPGAGFTVSDTHLYGLAANHTAVLRWDNTGTGWTPLGAPMTAPTPPSVQESPPTPAKPQPQETTPVAPSPQETVPAPKEEETESAEDPAEPAEGAAPDPDDDGQRDITPAPVQPAGPSDTLDENAVRLAVTAQDDLYTLTADKSGLWKRGSDGWSPLSGAANAVYAGRAGVFMTADGDEQVRKYNAATSAWDPIGRAAGQFAVTGKHLYRLVPDGIGEWNDGTWTAIGGPARNIYAGRAGLFATNPDTGDLYKYDGKPGTWTRIGGPGAQFAVGHDRVYGINPDHTAVYEWTGQGTDWTRIGGPAKNIYAGGAGLFATNPATGNINQYNDTPDAWIEIGGPGATFTVSDTQLYGLSPDLTTAYRWNGTGSEWTRIGGAADMAQQAQDEKLLAANCETGRDCVQEYRDAKELLETSLTDWLKDNSLDILLDTFGIDTIVKCAKGDPGKCLWAAVDVGGSILGVGILKKGGKLSKALYRFSKDYPKFIEKTKQAKDAYDALRKTIDQVEKLQESANGAEQRQQEPKKDPQNGENKPQYRDCRVFGTGWIHYSPTDPNNGDRATGAEACLDKAYLDEKRGTDTKTREVAPPAYTWAAVYAWELGNSKAWKWRNACHLIANQLGGSGTDYTNLATCSRTANSSRMDKSTPEHRHANMAKWEQDVFDAVKAGQVVHYTVTPDYEGSRVVPVAFRMQAYGYDPQSGAGIKLFDNLVENEMYSKSDKKWHNMGQWSPTQWVK